MGSLMVGFASFKDRSFELVVEDTKSGKQITLCGTLKPEQSLQEISELLPSCVFVKASATSSVPGSSDA